MPAGGLPTASIEFGAVEWREEVERYDLRSPARAQAQSARKTIEAYTAKLDWKRCQAAGRDGTTAGLPEALRPAWQAGRL
jgi:hypothetical protein